MLSQVLRGTVTIQTNLHEILNHVGFSAEQMSEDMEEDEHRDSCQVKHNGASENLYIC